MKRFAIPVILSTLALASCESSNRASLPPIPAAPASIEGTWVDPNGIVSTFAAGAFNTRTSDTNQLLASGTYVTVNPKLAEISMLSHVQNKQSKVNCALVSDNQLNCTADSGAQFSLARKIQ